MDWYGSIVITMLVAVYGSSSGAWQERRQPLKCDPHGHNRRRTSKGRVGLEIESLCEPTLDMISKSDRFTFEPSIITALIRLCFSPAVDMKHIDTISLRIASLQLH